MKELNPITKVKELKDDSPQITKLLKESEKHLFSKERDTRTQVRIRMLKTEKLEDKFTNYVIAETEAKTTLAGYLFLLLIVFLITLVI